jgi:hypothetical protein
MERTERDKKILEIAREQLNLDDELELDDDARISEGDDNGAWVSVWIYVSFYDTELDKEKDFQAPEAGT